MERVTSVTNLKASLSGYLAQVKSGEEILVTERGRPIARVIPYLRSQDPESSLELQIQSGLIRSGDGRSIRDALHTAGRIPTQQSVVEALLEEREDR